MKINLLIFKNSCTFAGRKVKTQTHTTMTQMKTPKLRYRAEIEQLRQISALLKRVKTDRDSVIGLEPLLPSREMEFLSQLFDAIMNRQVLNIRYRLFKANKPLSIEVHPYFLKQYNNRWYLLGLNVEFKEITGFVLDRIEAVSPMFAEYIEKPSNIDFDTYFDDVVGVTVPRARKEHIVMRIAPDRYPYIKYKPLHPSQRNYDKEYRIAIDVIPNNELIALLLSFGSQLEVLEPQSVRDMMRDHVKTLNKFYK